VSRVLPNENSPQHERTGVSRTRARPAIAQAPLLRGTETILVVEDEEAIRRSTKRALENQGYQVLLAADGEEGRAVVRAPGDEIDLVMTDLVMPRLGGSQLFEAVKNQGFAARFLFTCGYPPRAVQEEVRFTPGVPLLHKPWTVNELATCVREVLDQGSPASIA
jgi:DNA-binding NtrC family response regulator